jgi:hypothetical protein
VAGQAAERQVVMPGQPSCDPRSCSPEKARQLVASPSGGYGYSTCPDGVPVELALLTLLAGFGTAFGVLYRGLTQRTNGRRRRSGYRVFDGPLADLFWSGRTQGRSLLHARCLPVVSRLCESVGMEAISVPGNAVRNGSGGSGRHCHLLCNSWGRQRQQEDQCVTCQSVSLD